MSDGAGKPKVKVLFVCIENANRSQMAQAFAAMHGKGRVEAYSAGSRPSGRVHPAAVAAMQEKGYDLTVHTSKALTDLPASRYDWVIGMGCGDACPWVPARHREEWDVPDPKDADETTFRNIRDGIETRVLDLLERISQEANAGPAIG
jgi:protein-tyrosine-phosphatase